MNSSFTLFAALVVLAAVLWPRHGLLARWRRSRTLVVRARREDALKHILKAEVNGRTPSLASVAGALRVGEDRAAVVLADLERGGLLSFEGGAPKLRQSGRELARHVVRAHRLWESFLADQTGLHEAEWHRRAERQEHLLSPEQTDALAARLGNPLRDPHGDAIPPVDGEIEADFGQPLTDVEAGQPVMIVHMEDEPETVYRQLLALGLRPGMRAVVTARTHDLIRLQAEDRPEIELSSVLANNVAVLVREVERGQEPAGGPTLVSLAEGASATVVGLAPACRGAERRRLLDLGFVAGTPVAVELVSPHGDPTAYRVRGSLVALRREQAGLIRIELQKENAA